MTDNFKEIGSLFGREGAGAGFAKQTDKESFTYAFAWPEGDTWATLTGYLNLDEQPEEYVRRVLQDGGFRSDWGNPDYDPIGDFKETAVLQHAAHRFPKTRSVLPKNRVSVPCSSPPANLRAR